jgi:hypothetical protein
MLTRMAIGTAAATTVMPEGQAVPKQQQPQAAQATRLKKIEWYATHLVNEAVSKEKAGRYGDAIVDYLQAADLLLLLAKGTQDYTPWKAFSDRAIACQQRVRVLIAKRKLSEEAAEAGTIAPASNAAPSLPTTQNKV